MRVRSAFAVCGVIATIISSAPAIAQEEESFAAAEEQAAANEAPTARLQTRNYDHFEFDTVTGAYFGIATFYTADDTVAFNGRVPNDLPREETDNEIVTGELRLVMGGSRFQGGVMIPYHGTTHDTFGGGEGDIGNVRAHLKFIPLRSDFFDAGGGLLLSFPAGGDEVDEGISVPNIGALPFVTGTGHLGPVDLNGHIGYNFINHSSSNGSPESILYGSSLTMPIADKLGLRLELAGQQFTSGEDRNVVAIQPGVDFVLPLSDDFGLMLTAAGSYGIGGGAAGSEDRYFSRWGLNTMSGLSRGEWGIGGAVGVIWY